MNDDTPDDPLAGRIWALRIIVFALAAGLTLFLGMAAFLRENGMMAPPPATPLISYVLLGMSGVLLIGSLAIPNQVAAAATRNVRGSGTTELRPEHWLGIYSVRLIVGASMLEGAGMMLVVAYLLEGQAVCMWGAALFAVAIFAQVPTRAGFEAWAERQRYGT